MNRNTRRLDEIRVQRSQVENHYIDELLAGRLNRRDFLRRGSMIGLSVPTMGAILAACGGANNSPSSSAPRRLRSRAAACCAWPTRYRPRR